MHNYSRASEAYQAVDLHSHIEGASAHKLIDLLYNGALDKLSKAKGHIRQNSLTQKGQEISKAIAIVTELQTALSSSNENDIAQNLLTLYNYIIELVVAANTENDIAKIDEASQLLHHLRESWNLIPNEQRY